MRNGEKLSREQIRTFLEASAEVEFAAENRQEVYDWMSRTLRRAGPWEAEPGGEGPAAGVLDEDDQLEPGQRLEELAQRAAAESDTACARRMQTAKQKLFAAIYQRKQRD